MKAVLAILTVIALPLSAEAAVSRMFCALVERTPNPILNRVTKSMDAIGEQGFASTIMGRRFHAMVKVDMDGATSVRMYERVRLIVNQHSMIILDEEAAFGAQTEVSSDGHSASINCRFY
jgi:hypothetical protein